jgi:predicted DNA-binding protein with PD1-like motif
MNSPETLPMTRRCFFASAGLTAAGAVGANEPETATEDMPRVELLGDGEAKTFLLVFHTGQKVMRGLVAFAREQKLTAGQLTGIGAVRDAVVGYFEPEKKSYLRLHEKEQMEVLSLTGNLAMDKDVPFLHIHVALGRRDGSARGGHLFEMTARPTVELILTAYRKTIRRKTDLESGAELLDI